MLRNRRQRWLEDSASIWLACVIGVGALLSGPGPVQARGPQTASVPSVTMAHLPEQARDMMTLIYRGGPFRYDRDGAVFGNREQILPVKNRGYYREYTVRTPTERSRGARRIVCGGPQPAAPDACYYTDDHYASFRRIVQQAGP